MLEIYYTSAPQGLKRGSSGFCTIAATDGIAKPVLERLEALSGYRHHFAAGQGQANPVSLGHWVLNAGGRDYHVLSRVCDSGVDHTHRTNAFAHHLALDAAELSPAGPAAMLATPGVMTAAWDGTVGPLTRKSPPAAYAPSPGPCTTWAQLAGDAGYAGLLLEAAIRHPGKPACILFSPGTDTLPLIDEVLRLLPAAIRWAVTFNTYFTSMPTSATCAWRCCVAGTPAASAARAAAGGLVIDLSAPGKLPPLKDSPYVAAARSGTLLSAGAGPTLAKVAKKPAGRPPAKGGAVPPVPRDEDEMDLAAEIALAVQKYGTQPPPAAAAGLSADIAPLPELDLASPPPREGHPAAPSGEWAPRAAPIRNVEALLQQAESHAIKLQKRRKQQVVLMYSLGAVAMVIALAVVVMAYRGQRSAEDALVLPRPAPQPRPIAAATTTAPAETQPVTVADTQPVATQPVQVVDTRPSDTQPVKVAVRPVRTIIAPPLDDPHAREGANERLQQIRFGDEDIYDLRNAATLEIAFPDDAASYKYESPQISGTFTAAANTANTNPSVILYWKATHALGRPQRVATLTLVGKARLDVIWPASFVIKDAEATTLAYWVLSRSSLLAVDAAGDRAKAQKVTFKPAAADLVELAETPTTIRLPAELPGGIKPVLAGELPAGWSATFTASWETKDVAQRTAANQFWVGTFRGPGLPGASFVLTFKPKFAGVETDFHKRLAADEADLRQSEQELAAADTEVNRIRDAATPDLERLERTLADTELKATNPKNEGWTDKQATEYVRVARISLDNRRRSLEKELAVPMKKKTDKEALVKAFKDAVDGYKAIDTFEIALRLPNELTVVTLKLKKK